jgi:hypothetical protein
VPLLWPADGATGTNGRPARHVDAEELSDWTFLGWRALLDADKYLRRGSLWEAHDRLHVARELVWKLCATAEGATYPWHGLSQVLDHDPDRLPRGIEETVAGLDREGLRRAMVATAHVLDRTSLAAATACGTRVDGAMGRFARRVVTT